MIRMKEITNLCKILIDWYQFFSEIILPWIQLLRFFLFFIPRNRSCIRVSVGDSRQRGRLEKGAFYIFPGNFTVTWCRPLSLPFSLPSLLPIPASLFSFANSIGESFASCAPTVRKLNERLQLCSPPLQPAMLSLSLSLSQSVYLRETVYFTNLLLALRYVGIAKLACPLSCLQNSFPSFTCARVSPLSITRSLRACWLEFQGIFSVGNFCSDHSRNLVDNPF